MCSKQHFWMLRAQYLIMRCGYFSFISPISSTLQRESEPCICAHFCAKVFLNILILQAFLFLFIELSQQTCHNKPDLDFLRKISNLAKELS